MTSYNTGGKRKGVSCAPRKSVEVYDLNVLSDSARAQYINLPNDLEKARFLVGAGSAARPTFDVPSFDTIPGSEVVLGGPKQGAGNSWIVMGLDRPSFPGSGWGGQQSSHCAAIDIVVGRGGDINFINIVGASRGVRIAGTRLGGFYLSARICAAAG